MWWWQAHGSCVTGMHKIGKPACLVTYSLDGAFRIWNILGERAFGALSGAGGDIGALDGQPPLSPIRSEGTVSPGPRRSPLAPVMPISPPVSPKKSPPARPVSPIRSPPGAPPVVYEDRFGPVPVQWCNVFPGQLYRPFAWSFPGSKMMEAKDAETMIEAAKLVQKITEEFGTWKPPATPAYVALLWDVGSRAQGHPLAVQEQAT